MDGGTACKTWQDSSHTWTEVPEEAVESVRETCALGGGLKAALLPPSLSLAAILAHVLGFGASAGACCAGAAAGAAAAAGSGAAFGGGRVSFAGSCAACLVLAAPDASAGVGSAAGCSGAVLASLSLVGGVSGASALFSSDACIGAADEGSG